MEVFTIVLLVIIAVAVFVAFSGGEPVDPRLEVKGSPARITLDEAKQINRIASLQYIHPQLARSLAAKLQGDAWQIAQSGLCTSLLDDEQTDALLQLLDRLDPHHRGVALDNLLNHLIATGHERRALELLAKTGDGLPRSPLLKAPLLRAEGRLDEARAVLDEFDEHSGDAEVLPLLQLAREQRGVAQPDKAARTLERAWQSMQAGAELQQYLGLDTLLRELAELGDFARLQAIAGLLPQEQSPLAITELIRAGLFEQARSLISKLPSHAGQDLHEQMLAAMLERGQLAQAEELLATLDDVQRMPPLLHLAQWHIGRGTFNGAADSLLALARDTQQRIDLYLSLWSLHAEERPELAARLLEQAERWLAELAEDQRDELPFFVLEARLLAQSRLPARQRTSYELRRGLEEMERLLGSMDCYGRIANLTRLARLLHKLERDEDALAKLAQAHELLRRSAPDDELEDFDKALLLENIALAYLQLQHLDLALAARADIPPGESFGEDQWVAALVEHDHLQLAIQHLTFFTLHALAQPLRQLTDKLADLADQGQALRGQLLSKLQSDAFWEPSGAAA
ncbi:hypothetical protein AAFN46_18495 [Pseudomonas sp. CAU 1711]|uniref:hypothetical protein n=1 Tax=Pseudomonas sp. CAU 1711 TaxID=3140356 RepID=UPI003260CA01